MIQNDIVTVDGKEGKVVKVESVKDEAGKEIELMTVTFGEVELTAPSDAIELVSPDWYAEYYADISKLTTAYLDSLRRQTSVYATAIIRYRLDSSWTLEQTVDPDPISYELVSEIAAFVYQEKTAETPQKPLKGLLRMNRRETPRRGA